MTDHPSALVSVPVEGQSFSSEQDWINRASRVLTAHPEYNNAEHGERKGWRGQHFTALCFDQAGNRMRNGGDFMRATKEQTYPVWWIWPDQIAAMLAAPQAAGVGERKAIAAELYDYLIADRRKKSLTIPKDLGRRAIAALNLRAPSREPEGGAVDDLVDRFAAALKEKLHAAEAKHGHGDAWMHDDWRDDLVYALCEHIEKGDPRDVAAYCAFAWHHGWSLALATREEAPAEAGSFEERAIMLVRKHGDPNGSDYEQGQNDMGHRMVTMAREADALLRAQPQARSGKVTWHSSGEDEGPDVGLQLDIGGGCSLWLGEGKKPTGWQIAIVHDDEIVPVADVIDHEQARELFDRIASAVQPQAREDAQPVISAGRVLADALRQYGFPVSGGAKAALWDHGSAEALALNEACVAFLAALQAEQKGGA